MEDIHADHPQRDVLEGRREQLSESVRTMTKLSDYNQLTVVKRVDFGLYLDGGEKSEILLPKRYVSSRYKIGEPLEVFVYLDQDGRLVAATRMPLAQIGGFVYLERLWVNKYGAFLNWGLMRNLFCPFREQKRRMEMGERCIVYVYFDEESYRIVSSARVKHSLSDSLPTYQQGEEVDLLIRQKTDLGFEVIIGSWYAGLVYDNQIFRATHTGNRMKGYITDACRDGRIDATLQPMGQKVVVDFAETLLQYLQDHGGYCDLDDKSDAEKIERRFGVSKKTYKKAISDLYERRPISIDPDGIYPQEIYK